MVQKYLILIGLIIFSTVCDAPAKEPTTEIVRIRITPDSMDQLQALSNLEAYGTSEIPPHRLGRSYDFDLPIYEVEDLQNLGLRYEILPRNRNVWNDEDYFSYQEVHDILLSTVAEYPNIAIMENLGTSTRDNVPIWGLKLSDNPGTQEDEPDVLFNAIIHAREPVNGNILMAFIDEMTTGYGSDPDITMLLDNTEIWVIPILNPEGYLYVETGIDSPWWRKNKRDNDEDDEFEGVVNESCGSEYPSYPDGVDLNRNYEHGWYQAGSTMECSLVYRGPTYFSENESMLEQALFAREHMVAAISFHSYSEYVGYCGNDPAGNQLCYDIASSILKENGSTSYDPEFFVGKGQSYDWMYWEHGVQAYLVESSTEFFPSGAARIAGIVENNLNGMRTLLNRVHGASISGHVFNSVTHEPLAATIAVTGEPGINNPRMSEPVFGRFTRLLPPGNYSVMISLEGYHDAFLFDQTVQDGVPLSVDIPLTPVSSGIPDVPALLSLEQNHPNPFNPHTTIRFSVNGEQLVMAAVYDMSGKRVAKLAHEVYASGTHTLQWDGKGLAGQAMPSGTYLVQLQTPDVTESQKIMLVR